MPFQNGGGVTRWGSLEFLLRSFTTAVLALAITGAAIYQVVADGIEASPVINWAGIIVGVFFGAQVARSGEDRTRQHDIDKKRNGED